MNFLCMSVLYLWRQWLPGVLSLGVKRTGREADYWPPSSAEVKNACNYASIPQYAFMAWCSVKAQGLYLTLRYLTLRYLTCICDAIVNKLWALLLFPFTMERHWFYHFILVIPILFLPVCVRINLFCITLLLRCIQISLEMVFPVVL
jgi:hypothetical protein